jgi:hypothetical protein
MTHTNWQTRYPCSGCSQPCGLLTAQNGSISDGSGPSGYSNNANCEWIIAPPNALAVTLLFTELSTQPGVDIIRVFECTDIGCSQQQLLAKLSGWYSAPQTVTSSTGYMKVLFTSDWSINYEGFSSSWSLVMQHANKVVLFMQTHADLIIWQLFLLSCHVMWGNKLLLRSITLAYIIPFHLFAFRVHIEVGASI